MVREIANTFNFASISLGPNFGSNPLRPGGELRAISLSLTWINPPVSSVFYVKVGGEGGIL